MTDQYGDTPPGQPDPANATAEELEAKPDEAAASSRDAVREQVDQILRESEERTEENATVDPDDHSVIRRRTEETAETEPDADED